MFLPWGAGVNSELFAAECSKSPDPSPGASPRTTSFSRGVSMLRVTLKKHDWETYCLRSHPNCVGQILKRTLHSENASNVYVHPTLENFENETNLLQELLSLVILDLCLRKTWVTNSHVHSVTPYPLWLLFYITAAWLQAYMIIKIISQWVGGHRVYVGIRHPENLNRREITQITFSKSFVFKMFSVHTKTQSRRF